MRRTSLLIGGLAVGLAALTACGTSTINGTASSAGSGGGSTGGGGLGGVTTVSQLGQLVSANTSKNNSAHFTMSTTGTGAGAGTITASGVVQFGSPMALDETTTMAQLGQMEIILVNNTVYMKLPSSLAQEMGSSKPWTEINPNGTDAMSKALAPLATSAEQNTDPTKLITQLAEAGTITSTSSDTVDGQSTTKYTINVDLQKYLNSLPATSSAMKSEISTALQGGSGSEIVTVWINSQHLPVKFTSAISLKENGQPINVGVTGTYTDWGQPVTIAAPPASEVGTFGN